MYQHDLTEKDLDEKLQLVCVDSVAAVGVDVNACGVEILEKVPGLARLAPEVVVARPLRTRRDLLSVPGLGPKTFENCAAFCRVEGGPEPLDATLVHPESYDLARWLLNRFGWKLSEKPHIGLERKEWAVGLPRELEEAAVAFRVTPERVLSVLENLVDSISGVDPRLREAGRHSSAASVAGSIQGCSPLSPDLADQDALQEACPVRGVIGTVRNVADFGVFVDFGGHGDGLLHTSKLGPVRLHNLLVGQQIGVDVLGVANGRVSLGVAGLEFTSDEGRTTESAFVAKGTQAQQQRRSFSTKQGRGGKNGGWKRKESRQSTGGSAKRRKTTKP